jgi:hypothetical protein
MRTKNTKQDQKIDNTNYPRYPLPSSAFPQLHTPGMVDPCPLQPIPFAVNLFRSNEYFRNLILLRRIVDKIF